MACRDSKPPNWLKTGTYIAPAPIARTELAIPPNPVPTLNSKFLISGGELLFSMISLITGFLEEISIFFQVFIIAQNTIAMASVLKTGSNSSVKRYTIKEPMIVIINPN